MKDLLQFIDLTSLELTDNDETARKLVLKAKSIKDQTGISIASICVYPHLIQSVKKHSNEFPVACVAGGFPLGNIPLNEKINEVEKAIQLGADEIDFVIDRSFIFEEKMSASILEVGSAKKTCGNKLLKVILETGELKTQKAVEAASVYAIMSGADFIKTSTGKIPVGATHEVVQIMLQCIKTHFQKTGNKVGIKVSGGIATVEIAESYFKQVEKILGKEWLTPKLFRIGASRLIDDIMLKTGLKQP